MPLNMIRMFSNVLSGGTTEYSRGATVKLKRIKNDTET